MSVASHITRYSVMPIPPVEAHTVWFDAGAVRIGVEYRLLTDAIAAASQLEAAQGETRGETRGLDDRGVALHVCGEQDGVWRELLRFDCFVEDPHYHYVSWRDRANEMLHLDPSADGDPLAWALERIRTRLPQMLVRAGAVDVAGRVESSRLEALLPQLTQAAFQARFAHEGADARAASRAGGGGR